MRTPDLNDRCDPRQIEIYRRMSPKEKLDVFYRLYFTARELKTAGVKIQHPEWDDEQVEKEVSRIFLNARD